MLSTIDSPTVRMLLKSGYTHVYISRNFAYKAGLVDKKVGRSVKFERDSGLTGSMLWAPQAILA